jgi:hypothetical protein
VGRSLVGHPPNHLLNPLESARIVKGNQVQSLRDRRTEKAIRPSKICDPNVPEPRHFMLTNTFDGYRAKDSMDSLEHTVCKHCLTLLFGCIVRKPSLRGFYPAVVHRTSRPTGAVTRQRASAARPAAARVGIGLDPARHHGLSQAAGTSS